MLYRHHVPKCLDIKQIELVFLGTCFSLVSITVRDPNNEVKVRSLLRKTSLFAALLHARVYRNSLTFRKNFVICTSLFGSRTVNELLTC